jgi:glucose/arabinose dehydrogenase
MMRRPVVAITLLLIACARHAGAATAPAGFQDVAVVTGLTAPAVLAFAPDGRLFVGEQTTGKIRIVGSGSATTFLDVNTIVPAGTEFDSFFERGLLGIAFDPAFATNGFVYVYHTLCKKPGAGDCPAGKSKNRVIRVHATGDVADGSAPLTILDDIDSDAGNHNAGWIGFGPLDGKLYVATGDGGQDHTKSQNLASLSGKILRLEPNGSVPTDNPFFDSPSARGEVWASGLRNPWRCRFRDDGRLLCADVGQDTWEEIDVIFRANNYGWPDSEGPFTLFDFPEFTPPIHSYAHNGGSAAIMGGDFGAKTSFPGDYAQSYFFGDYSRGVIQRVVLDATGTAVVSPAANFVTGIGNNSVTDVVAGPDGALYYTDIGGGQVRRVFVVSSNHSPIATASALPATGDPPLSVQFSSAGSTDTDGDPLTFTWNFGDGSPPVVDPSPAHEYQNAGVHTATLTVDDGKVSPGPGVARVDVVVGHAPVVTITEPVSGTLFSAGESFTLAGSATDLEDGPLAASSLTWKIVFHHSDHTHPFIASRTGSPQSFTTTNVGETAADVGYEIRLSATDSDGITGTASVLIMPRTVDLTFETTPAGLGITLDGQPHVTPFTATSIVGMQRQIGAPAQPGFAFAAWSDGGAQTHTITAPATPVTLNAAFGPAPTRTPAPTPTPLGLVDTAAARSADICQRTITRATLGVVRATLAGLARCTNAVQRCLHGRPGDDPCMMKARATCARTREALTNATAKMEAGVGRRCPSIADVATGLGLGYGDFAAECAADGMPASDTAALAACIAGRHRCTSERIFQLEVPRTRELLGIAEIAPPAGTCLVDVDAAGAHVDTAAAKALVKCAAAIAKAATGFVGARMNAVGGCSQALFGCAQRQPDPTMRAACVARAHAACARTADPAAAAQKLRAAIDARCIAAPLPYGTLRATTGAFLDGVAGVCADHGVADLGSLTLFETCVVHQHECLAAELVRTAIPRATDLLTLDGRTLGPPDCPSAGGPQPQ